MDMQRLGRLGAYPRQRGGTCLLRQKVLFDEGLSPPARGNPAAHLDQAGDIGPIPASAGEPGRPRSGRPCSGAYPRQRGGTTNGHSGICAIAGLSPPARGNQVGPAQVGVAQGPIPASAGEPRNCRGWNPAPRAYPRQRGGTASNILILPMFQGLSPPARGNRRAAVRRARVTGPIPASAGEPARLPMAGRSTRAYPRQRGGTSIISVSAVRTRGLSPPARGNPHKPSAPDDPSGPIPASAGEPRAAKTLTGMGGAYPRQRGGTSLPGIGAR